MILKMKMNFGQYLMTMLMVVFVYACGDGSANHEGDAVEQEVEGANSDVPEKVVYYATPSLVEVATIMKSSGATFSNELLNNPENSSKYSTNFQKSINLGVYGADLTYSAMFDETQNSINYLKTIKLMAEDIGLTGAFETGFLESIEKNIGDRDALLDIITDFYWSADAYLTDNDRVEVSSLIIIGGWVESMYIACDMAHRTPNNHEIRKRIAEQKLMLKNLILFVKASASEDANVYECIEDLKDIQSIYEGIQVSQGTGNSVTNEQKGETIIGNQTEISMDEAHLDQLCMKLQEIRSRFVKL